MQTKQKIKQILLDVRNGALITPQIDKILEVVGKEKEEDFYVCPHHCGTGGYESCCSCGGWAEGEEHRLCSENKSNS